MKTLYEVYYWNKDDTDSQCSGYLDSIKKAVETIKEIKLLNRGYHDFIIRGLHAELKDDSFMEDGRFYRRHIWEKIYDDYEAYFDENGKAQ